MRERERVLEADRSTRKVVIGDTLPPREVGTIRAEERAGWVRPVVHLENGSKELDERAQTSVSQASQ